MPYSPIIPLLISCLVVLISTPSIIKVAQIKHLMDEPDSERKLHSSKTPTLGGIAIFAGTVFSFSFFSDFWATSSEIKYMTPALVLLFFAGIKDDILLLTPLKKLFVQTVCALLITLMGKLYFTSLWGMFEIHEITPWVGVIITTLVVVATINAFNLIDGVNGLSGGLGLIASLFFGSWFSLTNAISLGILSFSLAGALLGFLFFNFHRGKIFMGDTGSMLLGFIISILSIKFIENNRSHVIEGSIFYIKAAPGVAIGVILIPLIDMIRVFCQRILNKRNPFSADRRHIHHILQDLGLSHTQISLTLYTASVLFIIISLRLSYLRSMELVTILVSIAILLTAFAGYLKNIKTKSNEKNNSSRQ